MSDYRLKVAVQNARILEAIKEGGYSSAAELARTWGLQPIDISNFINLKKAPTHGGDSERAGELKETAKALCMALDRLPEELWTDEQLGMTLPRNVACIDVAEDELQAAIAGLDARKALNHLREIGRITAREDKVLERHANDETFTDIAEDMNVTHARVSQIHVKATRKLRQASIKLAAGQHQTCGRPASNLRQMTFVAISKIRRRLTK